MKNGNFSFGFSYRFSIVSIFLSILYIDYGRFWIQLSIFSFLDFDINFRISILKIFNFAYYFSYFHIFFNC